MSPASAFDTQRRMGRYGFEVQYTLLVTHEYLSFDPKTKKLGTRFNDAKLPPGLPKMPPGWYWVGDPTSKRAYMKKSQTPPKKGPLAGCFMSDHHDKYKGAVGYEAYWVYNQLEHVCFQLELVSKPFDDRYTKADFRADRDHIYRRVLPALLDAGVVHLYTPGRTQNVKEQLSLEVDDVRWPVRVDPMKKLARLGLGMWALSRFGHEARLESGYERALLDFNKADILANARTLLRYDLFTNIHLLVEAWLADVEPTLTWRWFRKLITSRAHTAIQTTAFNNDLCYWYVHGMADLTRDDFAQVTLADFDMYRALGIDSMYLDVYGGLPQPHLYQPYRSRRWKTQRSSLKYFVDQEGIEEMVRASVLGGTPSLERVQIPMNHPRKTITPGCIYIECRHAARVRMNKYDRDRWKDRHWALGKEKVPVGYIDHLQLLATDWLKQFDIALHVGEALFELIRRSDPVVVNRDIDELKRRLLRVIEIGYRVPRPPFIAPD